MWPKIILTVILTYVQGRTFESCDCQKQITLEQIHERHKNNTNIESYKSHVKALSPNDDKY